MKNNIKLLTVLTLLFLGEAQAQLGIGTITPDASAVLDITAIDKGLIMPRLTTAQRDTSIKSPTMGLLIYNTSSNALEIVISSLQWFNLSTGGTSAVTGGTTNTPGGLGFGTTFPDANAVLDITSTTKGVLLPRSASDPTGVAGMIYYNTTEHSVKLYDGTSWIVLNY